VRKYYYTSKDNVESRTKATTFLELGSFFDKEMRSVKEEGKLKQEIEDKLTNNDSWFNFNLKHRLYYMLGLTNEFAYMSFEKTLIDNYVVKFLDRIFDKHFVTKYFVSYFGVHPSCNSQYDIRVENEL